MGIQVTLPSTQVSQTQFFQDLSTKDGIFWGYGFDSDVRVEYKPTAAGPSGYFISETARPWSINPLRYFYSAPDANTKLLAAKRINILAKNEVKNILQDPSANISRINKALARLRDLYSVGLNHSDQRALNADFDAAIKTLKDAKITADNEKANSRSNRPGEYSLALGSFFNALGSNFWPFAFNQRMRIVKTPDGNFHLFVSSKPWFFQKLVKWPSEITSWRVWQDMKPQSVPAHAKLREAKNLAEVIERHAELIRQVQPDTDKMKANLLQMKVHWVRNVLSSTDKTAIEAAFDKAVKEVHKVGQLVSKDLSRSWKHFVWQNAVITPWNVAKQVPGFIGRSIAGVAQSGWNAVKGS